MPKLYGKIIAVALALGAVGTGCAYGSIATSGDKVVIARNDNFLFGALRSMYVCKITDSGLAECKEGESP